ncbi:COP1-interacting protein 7-like protein, partial [Drosera capensis]
MEGITSINCSKNKINQARSSCSIVLGAYGNTRDIVGERLFGGKQEMKSDTPLDYAVFQLSPRRSRCELFVSYYGTTEKLASGLVKPFVTHLRVAEEQVALAGKLIKLEVDRREKAETWFTKGTLERFVRFVSTPEILEMVHTFDAEMSQLEAARKIYSQGTEEAGSGGDETGGSTTTSDATKKELVRAIDVRLVAVRQDLITACSRASAAGFNPVTASELQLFADKFGAQRLSEACAKFSSLCQRRPDLLDSWKSNIEDRALRSSSGSDMSIDDPADDPHAGSNHIPQRHPDQLNSSSMQPSVINKQPSSTTLPKHLSSVSADNDSKVSGDKDNNVEAGPDRSIQASQPTRRLSVQDRINMFESKQKENSSSTGSSGKPVVGKSVELRRLSSDVSSGVEKAVLRRWSGASDMSIELSSDRREPDSNAGTPTSSVVSQAKPLSRSLSSAAVATSSGEKEQAESNDAGVTGDLGAKEDSKVGVSGGGNNNSGKKDQGDSKDVDNSKEAVAAKTVDRKFGMTQVAVVSDTGSEFLSYKSKLPSVSGRSENVASKEQNLKRIHRSRASFGGAEEFGTENQTTGQTQFKSLLGKSKISVPADHTAGEKANLGLAAEPHVRVVEKAASVSQFKEFDGDRARNDQVAQKVHTEVSASRIGDAQSNTGDSEVRAADVGDIATLNQKGHRSRLRASQRAAVAVMKSHAEYQSDSNVADPDSMAAQPKGKYPVGIDQEAKADYEPLEQQFDPSAEVEQSSTLRAKFHKRGTASEGKKARGRRDIAGGVCPNSEAGLVDGSTLQSEGAFSSTSVPPVEQAQRMRQSKELNDDLKMKANELEKLFAEHKLRVPGDQSNLFRRGKPIDVQKQEATPLNSRPETVVPLSQTTGAKMLAESSKSFANVNNFETTPPMKASDDQYNDSTPIQNVYSMSFTDDSKGKLYDRYMQKRDAKLREEWSSRRPEKEARMKAMHDSLEKSRAELNTKLAGSPDRHDAASHARRRAEKLKSLSARTTRRQQPIEAYMSDEDEDQTDFSGLKPHRQDGMSSDGSSRGTQAKKHSPNKIAASSTRSMGSAASSSSMKTSNSSAGRCKMQPENPLAQSVPNFSELRKENTKPSPGSSKTITRPQMRSYGRTKNGTEDKHGQSQSLRKSSANPVGLNECDSLDLGSLKSDKEDSECTFEFSSNLGMKPFMKKGNGMGSLSVSGVAKSISSQAIGTLNNADEELIAMAREEDDDFIVVGEDSSNVDKGEPRLSHGSDKSANSGSGNSDAVRCISQADSSSISELPLVTEPAFRAMDPVHDSPGESPVSWNAHSHNLYSFADEISDIYASVDSPLGSPAYWNSHSMGHNETEAARMRKKWGAAQKPIVAMDPSHGHSRKDVTKGFKRFLKFGRKHRGTEGGADWISATTSEGDDDTEDGREQANRSSDELRKSRMGFSQGRTSDDGFSEPDFTEQVQAFQSAIPVPPSNFKLKDEHLSGSSLKASQAIQSPDNGGSQMVNSKWKLFV